MNRTRTIVVAFSTLDGITQAPDGRDGTPDGGWAFRHGPEAVAGDKFKLGPLFESGVMLLGRTTWESFAQIWPSRTDDFSLAMNRIPKVVASHTLTDLSAWRSVMTPACWAASRCTRWRRRPRCAWMGARCWSLTDRSPTPRRSLAAGTWPKPSTLTMHWTWPGGFRCCAWADWSRCVRWWSAGLHRGSLPGRVGPGTGHAGRAARQLRPRRGVAPGSLRRGGRAMAVHRYSRQAGGLAVDHRAQPCHRPAATGSNSGGKDVIAGDSRGHGGNGGGRAGGVGAR